MVVRRSGRLHRREPLGRRGRLGRRTALRRSGPPVRRTPLRWAPFSPASEEQRAKVEGRPCIACGRRPVDPAHLVPRSLGGCDDPDCVVPLCRRCHRSYDRGELDLLPRLEPGHRVELQHALGHMPLVRLIERVTGERWSPTEDGNEAEGA